MRESDIDVIIHNLAMDFAARASNPYQSSEWVDQNLNRTLKLMRMFKEQTIALNKYRANNQQKMTVEHVNVNEGGQAIVGDMHIEGVSKKK